MYPKKLAKEKTKLWFEENKLSSEQFEYIFKKLKLFIKVEWKGIDKQFIPMPITWLNQKRWEDDIEDVEETKETKTEIDPELERRFNKNIGGNV